MFNQLTKTQNLLLKSVVQLGLSLLLVGALCHYLEVSGLDFYIQNLLFDSSTNSWLVDQRQPNYRLWFYILPKFFYLFTAIGSIFYCAYVYYKTGKVSRWSILLLMMIVCPTIVAIMKQLTLIYCPCQLRQYGGPYMFRALFDFNPSLLCQPQGCCFPAAHSTVGFSFISIFYILKNRALRYGALALILIYSWTLAFYQMAKGVHFVSHSIASMLICWTAIYITNNYYNYYFVKA